MAIIQTSGLISSIRGKVAGSVYQRSRSGTILRNNTTPVNSRSLLQLKTRSFISDILQEWIRLTDSQRLTWDAYVQYNPILHKNLTGVYISGQQAFIKFNSYRLEYDLPILSTPKFNKCALTPITLTLASTGAVLSITADRAMVSANEFIVLFLTIRFSPSVNNPGSRFKIIKFATTDTDTFDVTAAYTAIFGRLPQPGETLFMKYTNVSKLSGLPFPFKSEKVLL
ncbi:MAG: hypothetical protein ACE5IW_10240 [bacterium]